ncbi:hypothetical protein IKE67_02850 [bacterium]|nr:hypothetical protein [bacterium]
MKKFINIIAFLMAILIIVFMAIPTKTINRESAVYVEHDWDTLENVILGSPNMLSVPQVHKSVLGYGYILNNQKNMETAAGKPIQLVDPYSYGRIVEESEAISKDLKDKDVKITRLNPEVLDVAELQYMKNIQQGNNFLFPKDAVIVIGNNVIECAQRVPMRDKERFIVRRIFKPMIKEDPSIRYIAVPIPSPSFPDKGLYLEGSDILIDGKNIYVGYSGRGTSSSGIRWLQAVLGPNYTVYTINIKDFIHLNSVMTLIRPGLGIKVSSAIMEELPKPLQKWEFIDVSPEDAKKYAAGVFVVGPNKVYVDERFEKLISELRNKSVDVTSMSFEDISEFGSGLASFYSPIRRKYSEELNSEKIDAEYIKEHFNEFLETVKNLNYAEIFNKIKNVTTSKIEALVSMIKNR